jgi:hypothetical protein
VSFVKLDFRQLEISLNIADNKGAIQEILPMMSATCTQPAQLVCDQYGISQRYFHCEDAL